MSDEFLKSVAERIATAVGRKLAIDDYLPLSQREENIVSETAKTSVLEFFAILAKEGMVEIAPPKDAN